jgi:putative spermidine/putrescine transport system ATP-binding protein
VMHQGRIEQLSAPTELYARPRTLVVASFIGSMNLLPAPRLPGARADAPAAAAPAAFLPTSADRDVWAVRPEDVAYAPTCTRPDPDAVSVVVRRVLPHGHFQELVLDAGGVEVRAVVTGSAPAVGDAGTVTLRDVRHYRDGILVDDRPVAVATADAVR